ncbi:MAG: TOMM precursor leader peptide-binding protein, partial [Myxococcales bacterium]|nr:TOMM precursor leader peptide-binding protein [Myxococcales bacterium]
MARPAISPHFVVEVVAPDCVYLLSESRHVVLRGRAYASVVPLLDGSRSIEQISAALSGQLSVSAVRLLVGRLSIKGLISDGSERDERAAYLSMVGVGSAQAQARADAAIVALRAVGHCDVTPLRSALGALGLRCVEVASPAAPAPAAPATLTVVATDDYLRGELAAINSEMLARRAPWMLFKPRGGVLWFGPIFEPGHSACWRCLAQRLRGNRRVETMLEARGTTRAPLSVSRAALPTTIGAASSIAAGEVLSWLCAAGGVADGT